MAPEFIAASLTNGSPHCFAVSAISIEGFESLWSPIHQDTPRPDARNVLLYARQQQDAGSGFRFWNDLNGNHAAEPGELGLVGLGSSPNLDFSVERGAGSALSLTPVRAGTEVTLYGNAPMRTSPASMRLRLPTSGGAGSRLFRVGDTCFFQTDGGDGFARFGALRVTHAGQDFVIVDWSFQTDPGNIELLVVSGGTH